MIVREARVRKLREQFDAALDTSRSDGQVRVKRDVVEAWEEAWDPQTIGLEGATCETRSAYRPKTTVSLAEVTAAAYGVDAVRQIEARAGSPAAFQEVLESEEVMEAPAAITSTLYPKAIQQLVFNEVRGAYDVEAAVFTPKVPVIPSTLRGTEVVPSVRNMDPDDFAQVGEGLEYPAITYDESSYLLPSKAKYGGILNITREALFFANKTGLITEQARKLGQVLGINREHQLIDVLIGFVNNYNRDGTATNSYLTAGAYINNQVSLPLTDWNDIDTALQLMIDILDPDTSEPLAANLMPEDIIVMPHNRMTAKSILRAIENRSNDNPSAGTRSTEQISANVLNLEGLNPTLSYSQRLYRRVIDTGLETEAAKAQAGWFLGTLREFMAWYECWPLEVVQQGRESNASFERDIELRFKASFFGVAAVREPRKMLRLENAAWA